MNYYTSDLHLGHENILRMQNRPFNSIEEMNKVLIDNINARVRNESNDKLFILGDCSHHIKPEQTIALLSKIKCKRKYLIIGNHDKWQQYKEIDPNMFLDIQYYMEDICDQGAVFHLMHYPLLSFKHMRRSKTFMLHGHIHSDGNYNLENKTNHILRYDVGVDSNNFFPVSSKQILEFFGEEVYMNPNANYHKENL